MTPDDLSASAPGSLPIPPELADFLDGTKVLPLVGDVMRWKIIAHLLAHGPAHASALDTVTERATTTTSRHLQLLLEAGVLARVTPPHGDGRRVCYDVAPRWRVPGEPLTLEFGSARVRFSAAR